MTLDEYSKKCEEAADAVHLLVEEFDDDEDPHGVRQAILARHLQYVLPADVLQKLGA